MLEYMIGELVTRRPNRLNGSTGKTLRVRDIVEPGWEYIDDGMYYVYKYELEDPETGKIIGVFKDQEIIPVSTRMRMSKR